MQCEVCGVKLENPRDLLLGKHLEGLECEKAWRESIRLARARLRVVISELSAIRGDMERDALKYDHVFGEQMSAAFREDLTELLRKYAPVLRVAIVAGDY